MDIDKLLEEYYKLFPRDGLFPEWDEVPNNEKKEMLEEAINEKKDISETKLFEKYQEEVILRSTKK